MRYPIVAFADAAFLSDLHSSVPVEQQTGASWIGHLVTMFGSPIAARSAKVKVLCTSTRDAELLGAVSPLALIERAREVLITLGLQDPAVPSLQYTDSMVLLAALDKFGAQFRSRHLRLQFLILRNAVKEGLVKLAFLRSRNMPADLLTKHLGRVLFESVVRWVLGMEPVPLPPLPGGT